MPRPRSREAFPPVEVEARGGKMIITGGRIKRHGGVVGFAVETSTRCYNGEEVDFVAARLNDHWLLKTVGGESAVKGHCRTSDLLTLLKDKIIAAADTKDEPPAIRDEEDPMSRLKKVDVTPPRKRRNVDVTPPPPKKPIKNEILEIKMAKDCRCGDEVQVVAYRTAQGHIWIRVCDVPWFVSYIHSELQGDKVPEPWDPDSEDANDTKDAKDAVSAVAEHAKDNKSYRLAWSPNGTWTATITKGPLKGKDYVTRRSDISKEKWIAGAACLGETKQWAEQQAKRADRSMAKKVLLAYLTDMVEKRIKEAEQCFPAAAIAAAEQ